MAPPVRLRGRCLLAGRVFGETMRASGFILILCLTGCRQSGDPKPQPQVGFSQQSLAGRWLADSRLPDRRISSDTIVDSEGRYVLHLKNVLSDGVRTATLAGTWRIQDGQLVDTITNDIGGNTRVPRVVSILKIVRLDGRELVLAETNSSTMISYRRSEP